MGTHTQLTYEQRCQITALKKRGFSQTAIGADIGVNQSTISRELSRNTGKKGYRYKQAQNKADTRRANAMGAYKMTPDMVCLIESKLKEKWSPEQISGWILVECRKLISYEAISKHVWSDKQIGRSLYTHLRRHGKKYQSRAKTGW